MPKKTLGKTTFYANFANMRASILFLLLFPAALLARHAPEEIWAGDWLAGPLIAPSPTVNDFRVATVQPYLLITNEFGSFDNHWNRKNTPDTWSIQPLLDLTYGIASFIDIKAIPNFIYQNSQGASSTRLNDSPIILGFQALRQSEGTWTPDLRIAIQQFFPFGQYDKLNPNKNGTDGVGSGSYQSGISFNFQKTFLFSHQHGLNILWAVGGILYNTKANIRGLSVYGGTPKTKGEVRVGKLWYLVISGEYTLTLHWALALDALYTLTTSDRFSGKTGGAPVGNPTAQQVSLAPAVQYNYNPSFSLLGGVWFTVAGKNASEFFSGILSAVFTF